MFNKIKYLLFPFLCISLLTPAYAGALPDGSVRGLPQNLIVCDEKGDSVSADGRYYIHVEDMQPGVVYTKDISVMNLRQDAVYRVYMTMAPNHTEGTIDLENEVEVKLYLENSLVYTGDVNGNGTPDMQNTPLDLGGIYNSGDTRHLRAEFVWNMTKATEEHIQAESDAGNKAFGAVDFDWIFSAQVREDENSPDDHGGDNNDGGGSSGGGNKGGSTSDGGGKSHSLNPPPDRDKGGSDTDTDGHDSSGNTDDTNNGDVDDTNNGGNDNVDDQNRDNDGRDDNTDELGNNGSRNDFSGKGNIVDQIADQIADDLPFIPEDVKTGYHSRIVFYVKVLLVSLLAALILIVLTIYKGIKLRKKQNSQRDQGLE